MSLQLQHALYKRDMPPTVTKARLTITTIGQHARSSHTRRCTSSAALACALYNRSDCAASAGAATARQCHLSAARRHRQPESRVLERRRARPSSARQSRPGLGSKQFKWLLHD